MGLCTRFSLVALVVPLWEVRVGSTPKPPYVPPYVSFTLAEADTENAASSWITVQTVIYDWIKVQTLISTLIEIEGYDSPHEEAGSQPERPWVHAGHHERRCGGADSAGAAGPPGPAAAR